VKKYRIVEIVIEKVFVNDIGMHATVDFLVHDHQMNFDWRDSMTFEYGKFVKEFEGKFPRTKRVPTKREIHEWAKNQVLRAWEWERERKLKEMREAAMEKRFLDTFKTLKTFDEDCAKRQGGGQE
jgi:hypothetical protein